jgi:hypothetical protein|nr:hypothetical protein [Neorhizobium tomejilense]
MFMMFEPINDQDETVWIEHSKIIGISLHSVADGPDASVLFCEGGHTFRVRESPLDIVETVNDANRLEGGHK